MKAEKIEDVVTYLENEGIATKYEKGEAGHLNRVIEFEIEGTRYFIEWWVNQSYLKLKNEFGSPYLPFKYININLNSPTTEHRRQLCFYDMKIPNEGSFLYNEIPFGCLKIPFNK